MKIDVYRKIVERQYMPSNTSINGTIKSIHRELLYTYFDDFVPRVDDILVNPNDNKLHKVCTVIIYPSTSDVVLEVAPYIELRYNSLYERNEDNPLVIHLKDIGENED